MQVVFTVQAESDLEEIGDYIAEDSPSRALSFIREIREHCSKIAAMPLAYAARPELGENFRSCAHGQYLVIFQPSLEEVPDRSHPAWITRPSFYFSGRDITGSSGKAWRS